MQLTVREIIDMIDSGQLRYDQSTQRNFIYLTMRVKTEDGELTRAGNVIRSILQKDIQLPAIYFWKIPGEEVKYNIHDGKQRILSLYYFLNPKDGIYISTRINGIEKTYKGLSKEDIDKLYNYKFDVVIKEGPQAAEEESFYLINTNSVPLKDYESLRGMFYGSWIYQFENYISLKSKTFDNIKKIDRGEQAILFLYDCFGLLGDKNAINKVRINLRDIRNNDFDSTRYKLDEKITLFNQLKTIDSKISDERALQVASFIVEKEWDKDIILNYYRDIVKLPNDVSSWGLDTHITAISKLIQDGIRCDGRRFFTDNEKSDAYKIKSECAYYNCGENRYKELECDHIKPWSAGGRTELENLQLLCKTHNDSKGADEDGIKG